MLLRKQVDEVKVVLKILNYGVYSYFNKDSR